MHKLFYLLVFVSFLSAASAKNTRIVTVVEPPASFLDKNSLPSGYVVEIVEALKIIIGNEKKIEFVPEARAINISLEQENVLVFSLSRTSFREHLYHWVAPVMIKRWQVYALRGSDLKLNSLEFLRELPVIGVVRGDVREEWLINKGFKNLHSVTHHLQNVKRLLAERAPVIVYDQTGLAYDSKKLEVDPSIFIPLMTINKSVVHLVLSRHTSYRILAEWQKAFQQLKASGQLNEISQRWQIILENELSIEATIKNDILNL